MIFRALTSLKDNMLVGIVVALGLGLVLGQLLDEAVVSALKVAVFPVLFLMIYPMMINIRLEGVFDVLSTPRAVLASLLVNFVFAPAIAFVVAQVFFASSSAFTIGLYLLALIPTSGMTVAWVGLAKGDLDSALVMMAVNLLVAVVVLPLYLDVLIPGSMGFDPFALFEQLAKIVFVPMIAGTLTRRAVLHWYGETGMTRLKPRLGGLSSLGAVLMVLLAMVLRSRPILAEPLASVSVVLPLLVFYIATVATAVKIGRLFLSEAKTISLVYATGMRNLSIALGIAVVSFQEAALPIAIGYLIQAPLGAAYMHFRRDYEGSVAVVFDRLVADRRTRGQS
ncbi:MAG: arsenic resistance protein [Halanaeroarchaeum sp.]